MLFSDSLIARIGEPEASSILAAVNHKLKILIVDDQIYNLIVLEELLK